jgi:phosphoribosylformylglycinamidine synthase
MPDVRKAVTVDLKKNGDLVYLIGFTKEEMGGSAYLRSKGATGGSCPKVDASMSRKITEVLVEAIDSGTVKACHDLSDGGLGLTAAEMAIASGGLGLTLDMRQVLSQVRRGDLLLFSESTSRFLVEVEEEKSEYFERALKGIALSRVGEVTDMPGLKLIDPAGTESVLSASEMRKAWRGY